jgi:beta-ribofuranosylaminobenzene 5'-phosphate synthase
MSQFVIEIVAPSRLHFGMFSFGHRDARQFGGVGVMVVQPGVRLQVASAGRFEAVGPLGQRAELVVNHMARVLHWSELPACRIEVVEAAPQHVGLGTGTQLALAVAAGLNAFRGGKPLSPAELAAWSGRAERSAIGTYGFASGGLLVEAGKFPGESISPLEARLAFPATWRFVLTWPNDRRGLSGEEERVAFRDLPPVSPATTASLRREVTSEMLPAAESGDFARFSESLYRFGHEAGTCFAPRQGGAFASPRIEELVRTIRQLGVRGVGQSSWGPAVFALVESTDAARDLCNRLREHLGGDDTLLVVEPNNTGARITQGGQA